VIENSDFRKFDDSLRMVLDCTPELAAGIEDYLKAAAARGRGPLRRAPRGCGDDDPLHAVAGQSEPPHFIDGAQGGYALAAAALKESSARE
jgi:hypothetical protein